MAVCDLFLRTGVIRHKFNLVVVHVALAAADAPEQLRVIVEDKMIEFMYRICIRRGQFDRICACGDAFIDALVQCFFSRRNLLVIIGIAGINSS